MGLQPVCMEFYVFGRASNYPETSVPGDLSVFLPSLRITMIQLFFFKFRDEFNFNLRPDIRFIFYKPTDS